MVFCIMKKKRVEKKDCMDDDDMMDWNTTLLERRDSVAMLVTEPER